MTTILIICDLLLNFLYTIVCGIVLAYFIHRIIRRPVYCENVSIDYMKDSTGIFVTLGVKNSGMKAAVNCTGHFVISADSIQNIVPLTEKEIQANENLPNYEKEGLFINRRRSAIFSQINSEHQSRIGRVHLCWSKLSNPASLSLNPGVVESLDICRYQFPQNANQGYWLFPTEAGWRKLHMRIKPITIEGELYLSMQNSHSLILNVSLECLNGLPRLTINRVREEKYSLFKEIRYVLIR